MMDAKRTVLRIAAAFAVTFLAACGASPTYEERLAATSTLFDELQPLFNTGFTGQPGEMPSTGTALFSGSAIALLGDSTAPADLADLSGDHRLVLLGEATLTADFGAGHVSGSARDFFGRQGDAVAPYDGRVTFLNGDIGETIPRGDTRANDVRFGYSGTLTGQGNTVALSGDVDGKFKGTPIRGLIAEGTGTAELNGTQAPVIFGVIAKVE